LRALATPCRLLLHMHRYMQLFNNRLPYSPAPLESNKGSLRRQVRLPSCCRL